MPMPSNHLYGEYSSLGTYKLLAPNLFAYLDLLDWMTTCKIRWYSQSEDKQRLTVYFQIFNWMLDDIKEGLPNDVLLEKD